MKSEEHVWTCDEMCDEHVMNMWCYVINCNNVMNMWWNVMNMWWDVMMCDEHVMNMWLSCMNMQWNVMKCNDMQSHSPFHTHCATLEEMINAQNVKMSGLDLIFPCGLGCDSYSLTLTNVHTIWIILEYSHNQKGIDKV